ncbi:hypothetical protein [Embleya sp. NPDC001921]
MVTPACRPAAILLAIDDNTVHQPVAYARQTVTQTESGRPSVDTTILLASFKVGEAERVMSEGAVSMDACRTFPGTKRGLPVNFTLQASSSASGLGDQSAYIHVLSVGAHENLATTYLVVRVGNTIARFMSSSPAQDGFPPYPDSLAKAQVLKLMDVR